jgi:hypothetical protein
MALHVTHIEVADELDAQRVRRDLAGICERAQCFPQRLEVVVDVNGSRIEQAKWPRLGGAIVMNAREIRGIESVRDRDRAVTLDAMLVRDFFDHAWADRDQPGGLAHDRSLEPIRGSAVHAGRKHRHRQRRP